MCFILKEWINVESKIKQVEKEQGSRKGGSDSEPSRLLDVAVAFARLHDNIACCDDRLLCFTQSSILNPS